MYFPCHFDLPCKATWYTKMYTKFVLQFDSLIDGLLLWKCQYGVFILQEVICISEVAGKMTCTNIKTWFNQKKLTPEMQTISQYKWKIYTCN